MSWKEVIQKIIREFMRHHTLNEIISRELLEAHFKKLEAESAVEYARSIVQYNEQRIKRLEHRLMEHKIDGGPV
jgi:hypothetical protein